MSRRVLFIGGGITLAVASALAGRLSAPEAPARIDVREVERVVYQDRVVEVAAKAETQTRNVLIIRDRTVTPDGTVREREVLREQAHAAVAQLVATETTRVEHREATRQVEVRAPSPTWRVSALAGSTISMAPAPVAGLHIQRRLWGPLSAGAWTLAPMRGGAPVTAGVSLGVEF